MLSLLCGCSLAALAGRAGAQSAPTPPPAVTPAAPSAPSGQVAAVQEIVVTAQKREQRLQDIPVTVSVVSGDQLKRQGITDATQLQYTAPELTFTSGPSSSYAIRGIGTQTYSRTASSDVSIVLDGVIQGQPDPPVNSLFDVQRVEILSGPQGMLFGKNASAGVINIVTNPPDPSKTSLTAHADVGEHDYQVYQGTLNLPVSSNSALRVSVFSDGEGSLIHNLYDDRPINQYTDYGGRARYLFYNEAIKINIIADYEKKNGDVPIYTVRDSGSLGPGLAQCGVTPGAHNTDVCLSGPNYLTVESYGLSGQVDIPLGRYTLTSITADRQYSRSEGFDTSAVAADLLNINTTQEFDNQVSEELRLTSPAGERLEYVAGLYFYDFNFKLTGAQAGNFGILPFQAVLDQPTQHVNEFSYAGFAQATLHLWQGLSLIGGGRETRDSVSAVDNFTCDPTLGVCLPGLVTAIGTSSDKVDYNNFSYRIGGQYKFNRDDMVYLTYTRGYKGPAVNTPYAGDITTTAVKPEIPLYLELGAKAALFDRRLVLDMVAFHDTVKDFQAQVLDTKVFPSVFVFANASKLRSDGVQANFMARPFEGFSLQGGVLYNHAVYGDFLSACTPAFCNGAVNVKGQQLANAPRWSANLNGEYDHTVVSGYEGYLSANVSFRGPTSSDPPDPKEQIASYAIVNGRLGVRTEDGRYGLAIFARNLFDNRFTSIIFPDPVSGGSNYDQAFSRDAFRVIGVSLDVNY
jgi:iron complex outermembrane receptor protein